MRLLFLVPMYYIQNSNGYALDLFRTGSGGTRYKSTSNLRFQSTISSSAIWYFLDNGKGYFQIVNYEYRQFLSCDFDNNLALIPKSLADDSQKWSVEKSRYLVNKLCKLYLGITDADGMPALTTNNKFRLSLVLA